MMKMKKEKSINNSTKAPKAKQKHTPLRSCIACRDKRNHRELIRLTCNATDIEISVGKRKEGRGAYLCPTYECWEIGLKKNRLEYALRTKLTMENRQKLMEYGKTLPKKGDTHK